MRVMILHASAGAGHKRAAEALAAGFRQVDPDTQVLVSDILDFTPALFRDTYAKGYLRIVRRAPELWGYMYTQTDRKALVPWRRKVRSAFNHINARSFFERCREFAPDAFVCTHFMPLELLSTHARRRRTPATPLFCVVTDLAVHSLWIAERVNCYYVATEMARRQLVRQGQPETGILNTGIPVDPVFAEHTDPAILRGRLGLQVDRPVVMIASGGFGVGPTVGLLRAFKGTGTGCQLVVVAGANEGLRQEAEAALRDTGVAGRVFGFVNNMHELMEASDLVITKSGGLTISEALAKGRPMMIIDPIPGQEQMNCELLLEAGAAVRLHDVNDAPHEIGRLLADTERLERMRYSARTLGRPRATAEIVADIRQRLG